MRTEHDRVERLALDPGRLRCLWPVLGGCTVEAHLWRALESGTHHQSQRAAQAEARGTLRDRLDGGEPTVCTCKATAKDQTGAGGQERARCLGSRSRCHLPRVWSLVNHRASVRVLAESGGTECDKRELLLSSWWQCLKCRFWPQLYLRHWGPEQGRCYHGFNRRNQTGVGWERQQQTWD